MDRQQDSAKFSRDLDQHITAIPDDDDALDENTLAANLAELVNGECDAEDFEKVWDPECTESFKEAGVLTSDEGFRFRLGDGRWAYVTVQIQSR